MPNVEELYNNISRRPLSDDEKALLKKAYNFANKAHGSQKRDSGEPYFNHAFETAKNLLKLGMDAKTAAAGLLHDIIEDTNVTEEDIKKEFNDDDILFLIKGVTKLGTLKYRGRESQVDNLRKLFLAMASDLRVVIIKLADRLHNMKTLQYKPPQKQRRIALETYEIYAPLAYRLGMTGFAGEIEDLAFCYLYPKEYQWLLENVREQFEERQKYLERVEPVLREALKENSIEPLKIDFRAKRYSSLYKKLLRNDMNLDQIYDLVALRVVVKTIEDCYAVLGIVHNLWPPLPGRIKDYIALPKPNGYRSLHTTVFCLDNRPTEIQIRTLEMHEESENGIAAHWAYEQKKGTKDYLDRKTSFAEKSELTWVQQLKNWQKDFSNPEDFLKSLKIDFFKDRIFAITPKGEVVDLPAGATPIDFAYAIHSTVGDECVGAKINGKISPLDYQLQSGDMVEILMQKSKKPSESWLRFAKTDQAKRKIKSGLKGSNSFTQKKSTRTEFRIVISDRIGILKDITAVVSRSRINIINVNLIKTGGFPNIKMVCELSDKRKIESLVFKLKKVKEVREINYKSV